MTECLELLTPLLTSSLLSTVLLTALVLTLEQMKLQKVEVFVHSFHEAGILFLESIFEVIMTILDVSKGLYLSCLKSYRAKVRNLS